MTDTFKGIITADGKKRQLPYENVLKTPLSDVTLSKEGAFADAKVTGDNFAKAKAETDSLKEDIDNTCNAVINQHNVLADKTISKVKAPNLLNAWEYVSTEPPTLTQGALCNIVNFNGDDSDSKILMQDVLSKKIPSGNYNYTIKTNVDWTGLLQTTLYFRLTGYPTSEYSGGTILLTSETVIKKSEVDENGFITVSNNIDVANTENYHHIRVFVYIATAKAKVKFTEIALIPSDSYDGYSFLNDKIDKALKNPLYGKTIYADGDSIMYGAGNNGKGFADLLAEKYGMVIDKFAVSGGTIANGTFHSDGVTPRHYICESVISNCTKEYDYVILDGLVNDKGNNVPIGSLSTNMSIPFTNSPNKSTFIGALESIFQHIENNFPTTKIIFVITHKWYGSFGINQQNVNTIDYISAIKSTCNRYGVTVIDLFNECQFNTYMDAYIPYTNNLDKVHPTEDGYNRFYLPSIEKIIK